MLLGCIYRSPNSPDENNDKLLDLLSQDTIQAYDKVCIVGDFNYPGISWERGEGGEREQGFIERLRDAYLCQMTTKPTRRRLGQQATLDDLVLVNDVRLISDIEHLCPFAKSDHEVLTFTLYVDEKESTKETTMRFDLPKGNYSAMREDLSSVDWTALTSHDTDKCWETIKQVILTSMNKHIPKVKAKMEQKVNSKWMTNNVLKSVKKKYNLYKKFLQSQKSYDFQRYITVRNECKKFIKKAKREYEQKLARNAKINPKSVWKYIQSKTKINTGISPLMKDGKLHTTDKEKADILNSFFASVFVEENGQNIPHLNEGEKSGGRLISDVLVTPDAVRDKLKGLNPNKAQGPDLIPPRVLKELANELSLPLSILFNKTMEKGSIPSDWKRAEVVPIFKKGTKTDPSNYRPVSLTCVCCKILESIVRDTIVNHMNDNNLYTEQQHGFRKHRSCMTQLLEVMEDLTQMLDDRHDIDIVYLDFRKAFDTVPHKRLICKLKGYGITGKLLEWIEDFLKNRSQKVRIGREYSTDARVLSGIPQGSILGPVLFTVFINDLPDSLKSLCKIFVDDTKLYNSSKHSDDLQSDIDSLQAWTEKWLLFFNETKCKVMHAGNRNPRKDYHMGISDTITIETCNDEKDLGVIFDENLKFSSHINKSINKANQMIGIIKRSFTFLDQEMFLNLYKALVRPHLEYGNLIWGYPGA